MRKKPLPVCCNRYATPDEPTDSLPDMETATRRDKPRTLPLVVRHTRLVQGKCVREVAASIMQLTPPLKTLSQYSDLTLSWSSRRIERRAPGGRKLRGRLTFLNAIDSPPERDP